MLMTKMAPLTVALCVAVALQPVLATSVQKEVRVPKTSVGGRSLFAWKRYDGFNPFLLLFLHALKQYQEREDEGDRRYLVVPRKGRGYATEGEESERGGDILDPITRQVNPDRACAEEQRNGPLHEGLPFRLIQHQFQTADENGNGTLEKAEVKKFLDELLVLKFCMDRTA